MRVPPSQGLVRRNILTQLSRERGGAIEHIVAFYVGQSLQQYLLASHDA